MFQGGVGGQDGVVRLDNRVGQGGRRVHAEFELRLLAIVGGEALEDKSTETGTSSTTERVENEEALETTAVISQSTDFVHHSVNLVSSYSVVATSV